MSDTTLPALIGRYRPLAVLGSGAMGTVYRAHDPAIDRVVAVKVIRTEAIDPEERAEYVARFRREVQAAGRCSHPCIVGVYDCSTGDEAPFIVMEMVEGRTLQALMRDPAVGRDLPITALMARMLDALGAAHAAGITHRDMKPANILVTAAGVPKIADFGIARLSGVSLTLAGTILGTPSYMAPEQIEGAEVDGRADLFSVGCILYEFYAGKPPFAGRNFTETVLRLSRPDEADLQPVEAGGGGALTSVLARALAKDRAARFQSAGEFADALADAVLGPATAADDATVVYRRMTPPIAAPAPVEPFVSATLVARWDAELLGNIERALARYTGPMARVMVAQAARRATTAQELMDGLAAGLDQSSDRGAFLREAGQRAEPTLGTAREPSLRKAPTGQVAPPSLRVEPVTQAFGGIAAQTVESAQAALVVYVGPMARVLARKAAAEAVSADDFVERLCKHLPKPDESAALRRRLRADAERGR